MDLERDEWWCKVQKWLDGHWRIVALGVATVIAAVVVGVIVHRLNETDHRLERAMCIEVAFLEAAERDGGSKELLTLAARLRSQVACPPTKLVVSP